MMLVLVIGLATGAVTAQVKDGGFAPVGIFTGEEIDEGICSRSSTPICYGNAFAVRSFGESETHHLSVSIDYMVGGINPNESFPVIDGSWTLVVYRDNSYAGTLKGNVLGGMVLIDYDSNLKHVLLDFRSGGGSGIFEGKAGENISGIYQTTTNMLSQETSGSASFSF
jgi:hypothetical protein